MQKNNAVGGMDEDNKVHSSYLGFIRRGLSLREYGAEKPSG
jgi:hypothetical protein